MTKFTDYENREWDLALSIPRLRLVKKELQIDLLNLHRSPETLERLEEDPVFLVDVISVLLTDEITKRELDADGFAAGLVNNESKCQPIIDATNAILGAIVAFSPPEKARAIREVWMKARTLTQTTLTHMANKVETNYTRIEKAALEKADQAFDKSMMEIFGTSSGNGAANLD